MGRWQGEGVGVMRIYTLTNQLRRRLMVSLFREASKVAVGFYRRIFAWTNKHPTRTPPPNTTSYTTKTTTNSHPILIFSSQKSSAFKLKTLLTKTLHSFNCGNSSSLLSTKKKRKKANLLLDSDERVPKLMTFLLTYCIVHNVIAFNPHFFIIISHYFADIISKAYRVSWELKSFPKIWSLAGTDPFF